MAEHYYKRCMELWHNDRGLASCLGQLGIIANQRYFQARDAQKPKDDMVLQLTAAANYTLEALRLMPKEAFNDLAATYNVLAGVYGETDNVEQAVKYYRLAVSYYEKANELFGAASVRMNIAQILLSHGRCSDARDYAVAALHNYEAYGDRAATDIENTQALIAKIEQALQA